MFPRSSTARPKVTPTHHVYHICQFSTSSPSVTLLHGSKGKRRSFALQIQQFCGEKIVLQQITIPPLRGEGHDGLLSVRQVPTSRGKQERTISVHLAECHGLRSQASILINQMYSWRGYGSDHKLTSSDHRSIFTVCSDNQVIGTLTLSVDTPKRLATDQTFSAELDELRSSPGTKLCELTKFAIDPSIKSPQLLAALFHVIFLYGPQSFGCTDVVIELHPRHVRYYEAMLGFERVGAPKIDASVEWWPSDTPVQLMRLNLRHMRQLIDFHKTNSKSNSRSLYPYFFSQEEEQGIATRIARLSGGETLKTGRARSSSDFRQVPNTVERRMKLRNVASAEGNPCKTLRHSEEAPNLASLAANPLAKAGFIADHASRGHCCGS
jgi:hypothetical protein